MKKKMIFFAVMLVALVLVTAVPQSTYAADLPLDTFADTTLGASLSITSGSTSAVDQPVTSAMGSVRDLSLTHVSGTGNVSLEVQTGNGILAFASAPGVTGNFSIRWDGTAAGPTPNLNTDLTDSGVNDGFLMNIYADQSGWSMQIDVRDQADTTTATYNFTETDNINGIGRVYYIPFTAFTNSTVLTGGNVGSVQISVTGVVDLDMTLDFIQTSDLADNLFDFGDLPEGAPFNYGMTTLASDGAAHFNPGATVRLGTNVDTEADGQADANAGRTGGGDDAADDEDGVVPVQLWNDNTFEVDVSITGANGCVSAWLDWNDGISTAGANGDFNGPFETFIDNQPITQAESPKRFTLNTFGLFGGDLSNQIVYARFRVVPDVGTPGCSDQDAPLLTDIINDGEVEDYRWEVSPTAVSLQNSTASSASPFMPVMVAIVVALVGTGVVLVRRQRA